MLAGWEGQANDTAVLSDAFATKGLVIPPGSNILVDNGYPNRMAHLAPYRGVRYHLKEFSRGIDGCSLRKLTMQLSRSEY